VKLIVSSAAAGSSDLVARVVAQQLQELWKQPVIIDNRGAVNGVVGAELGQKAPPDGYTLTVGNSGTHVMNYGLYKTLPYDPLNGFAPIAKLAIAPGVLLANARLPYTNVHDMLAHAKSHPTYVATPGATAQFAALMLNSMAGAELTVVPYKGNSQSDLAVAQGEAQLSITTLTSARPHVESGRARILATMGRERASVAPDLPTVAEGGVPGYELEYWVGLFAPLGTPAAVIEKVTADLKKVLAMPEVVKRLEDAGFSAAYQAPGAFGAATKESALRSAKEMRRLGIEAQ
jgi:tripartite-type tricarboxylate transporter receptor subunit TctC